MRISVLACLLALTAGLGAPLGAADFTWNVDGDGDWGDAANWNPANVPGLGDNITITNLIDAGNPVAVNVGGGIVRDVANITIDPTHQLVVPSNTFLDVSGDIANQGEVVLDSTGATTLLRAESSDLTFSGNGRLILSGEGANGLTAQGNLLITNAASHTIEGAGNLGSNSAVFSNLGFVDANVDGGTLTLDPRSIGAGIVSFTNDGMMQASNGGVLLVTGNGGGEFGGVGSYHAQTGSEVVLTTSATVRNSTFDTSGTGLVRAADGQDTNFVDITNNGHMQIGNNTDARMSGTITNTGQITLASTGSQSDFELGANVTLTGGGTLTLEGPDANLNSVGNFTLTNVNNTIEGAGDFGQNGATIINDSLIDANVSAGTLALDPRNNGAGVVSFTNNNLVRATNGGTLLISGNGGGEFGGTGTYQAQAGSEVVLTTGATVRDSTFETAGDGVIRMADGQNVNLVDITNNGHMRVGNNTDARMSGTITNTDQITLASTGSQSDFELGANVTLTGGGTLTLEGPDANLNSVGNFTLTNVNNTIEGAGDLGQNGATIINNALIDANVAAGTLALDPRNIGAGVVSFTNNDLARASNGGTLLLSGNGGGEFGGNGTYLAQAGSEVVLTAAATIRNSTLDTEGSGVVRAADGQNVFFVDVTNAGQLRVGNNTDARMSGTITNTGDITLASVNAQSDFELGADVNLNGGGTLTLVGPDANINSVGSFTLTNVNNTIQGSGDLGMNVTAITNRGLILSDQPGGQLRIDPRNAGAGVATFVNELGGELRANGTGTVILTGSGGGEHLNHNGGRFVINSTAQLVTSATLRNEAGGRIEGSGTIEVLSGTFVNSGGVVAPGESVGTLTVDGTYNQGMDGSLEIEIDAGGNDLLVAGTANLDGTLDVLSAVGDPVNRGDVAESVVIEADVVNGTFAGASFNGSPLAPLSGTSPFIAYDGISSGGMDGMFRGIEYADDQVSFFSYLALAGDANGDRIVDGQDFLVWNQNKFTSGNDWSSGDFNGDGITDGADFLVWNSNKFTGADINAVPEPAGLSLFAASLLLLRQRRRKSRQ